MNPVQFFPASIHKLQAIGIKPPGDQQQHSPAARSVQCFRKKAAYFNIVRTFVEQLMAFQRWCRTLSQPFLKYLREQNKSRLSVTQQLHRKYNYFLG